jgi:hypothetical protein
MFRLRADETVVAEGLTSAQAQIAVGEILEEMTAMEQPKFPNPQPYFSERPSAADYFWPLVLTWAFVGIPLLWGVYGTVVNALKLSSNRPRRHKPSGKLLQCWRYQRERSATTCATITRKVRKSCTPTLSPPQSPEDGDHPRIGADVAAVRLGERDGRNLGLLGANHVPRHVEDAESGRMDDRPNRGFLVEAASFSEDKRIR